MSISVKKHPEYKLKLPQFLCDTILKENPPPFNPFTNDYKCILFVGRPQSGKTSMLVSCLLDKQFFKKTFHSVTCVTPETSRNSMKGKPLKDVGPSKLFDNIEEIYKIYNMLEYYSSNDESSLLLIDDQQSYLKRSDISTTLNHIIANRRHLKTTICILVQTYNTVPLKTRKLVNTTLTWRPSKKEWENLVEETLELNDELADKVFKISFPKESEDKHRWLLVDVPTQRLFAGFDELVIHDNE